MPRSRNSESMPAAAHDVTTAAGFLAEYDAQAAAASRILGWCSVDYAYSCSGSDDGGYNHRIPAPNQRQTLPAMIPAEYLSEAGIAWQAGQSAGLLERFQNGAREAILYGMLHQNLDQETAQAAATSLGLGTLSQSDASLRVVLGLDTRPTVTVPLPAGSDVYSVAADVATATTETVRTALQAAGTDVRVRFMVYDHRQDGGRWEFTTAPASDAPASV